MTDRTAELEAAVRAHEALIAEAQAEIIRYLSKRSSSRRLWMPFSGYSTGRSRERYSGSPGKRSRTARNGSIDRRWRIAVERFAASLPWLRSLALPDAVPRGSSLPLKPPIQPSAPRSNDPAGRAQSAAPRGLHGRWRTSSRPNPVMDRIGLCGDVRRRDTPARALTCRSICSEAA